MLRTLQNTDGGWPYQRGGGSWTEPTVLALLALQVNGELDTGALRAFDWLRRLQRTDGGVRPRPAVDESTWVTSLALMFGPDRLGADFHARAMAWVIQQTGEESTFLFRLRLALLGKKPNAPVNHAGWCWFPGTAAWVGPTCHAILALRHAMRVRPSGNIRARIEQGQAFLLDRMCKDGGWNHGSIRALGYDTGSYPEMTGLALLALAGTDAAKLERSCALAEGYLREARSAEACAWLRLGLKAQGREPAVAPAPPARTVRDMALEMIASAASKGQNVFLS